MRGRRRFAGTINGICHDRLHHRWRRAGRLRSRQPAFGRPGQFRAFTGGRRQGLASADPHAGGLRQDDQGHRFLGLVDRAAEAHEGPCVLVHAGQGGRWRLLDQRADLHARQRPRLRRLGEGGGLRGLGLSRHPALLQTRRKQPAIRQRLPFLWRTARRFQSDCAAADLRGVFPGGPGNGHTVQPGFQRRQPGRRRLLPVDAEGCAPFIRFGRLSEADPRPEEPDRQDRRAGDAGRGRKGPRGWRRNCRPTGRSTAGVARRP